MLADELVASADDVPLERAAAAVVPRMHQVLFSSGFSLHLEARAAASLCDESLDSTGLDELEGVGEVVLAEHRGEHFEVAVGELGRARLRARGSNLVEDGVRDGHRGELGTRGDPALVRRGAAPPVVGLGAVGRARRLVPTAARGSRDAAGLRRARALIPPAHLERRDGRPARRRRLADWSRTTPGRRDLTWTRAVSLVVVARRLLARGMGSWMWILALVRRRRLTPRPHARTRVTYSSRTLQQTARRFEPVTSRARLTSSPCP